MALRAGHPVSGAPPVWLIVVGRALRGSGSRWSLFNPVEEVGQVFEPAGRVRRFGRRRWRRAPLRLDESRGMSSHPRARHAA